MTAENYDTFFASQYFFQRIIIISRSILRTKFYVIKSCPIWLKLWHILPDTLSKKCESLNHRALWFEPN